MDGCVSGPRDHQPCPPPPPHTHTHTHSPAHTPAHTHQHTHTWPLLVSLTHSPYLPSPAFFVFIFIESNFCFKLITCCFSSFFRCFFPQQTRRSWSATSWNLYKISDKGCIFLCHKYLCGMEKGQECFIVNYQWKSPPNLPSPRFGWHTHRHWSSQGNGTLD